MTPTETGPGPVFRNAPFTGVVLTALTLGCWVFFLAGAGTGMDVWKMSMPGIPPVSAQPSMMANSSDVSIVSMTFMWWTMMLAMMMPGAFRHLPAYRENRMPARVILVQFWMSYAAIWLAFSVAATGMQYFLVDAGWVHGMKMWSSNKLFSTVLLTFAGLYQFSGMKARRLTACHSVPAGPSSFGNGVSYGLNCLFSSGPLMLLLFVGGVMNVYWVVLLTVLVTIEKTMKQPRPFSVLVGIACLGAAAITASS